MSRQCSSKKSKNKKVIQIRLREDSKGFYFPYCSYPPHEGILFNGEYKRCERRNCPYYFRFRSERDLVERINQQL